MLNKLKKENKQPKRKKTITVFVKQFIKDGKNKNTSCKYGKFSNKNGKIKKVSVGLTDKEMKVFDDILNKVDDKVKKIEGK